MQPTGYDNGVDRHCSRRGLLRGTLGGALGVAAFEGVGLTSPVPIASNKKLLLLFLFRQEELRLRVKTSMVTYLPRHPRNRGIRHLLLTRALTRLSWQLK